MSFDNRDVESDDANKTTFRHRSVWTVTFGSGRIERQFLAGNALDALQTFHRWDVWNGGNDNGEPNVVSELRESNSYVIEEVVEEVGGEPEIAAPVCGFEIGDRVRSFDPGYDCDVEGEVIEIIALVRVRNELPGPNQNRIVSLASEMWQLVSKRGR